MLRFKHDKDINYNKPLTWFMIIVNYLVDRKQKVAFKISFKNILIL